MVDTPHLQQQHQIQEGIREERCKCQDSPLHSTEMESVHMIKCCTDFLVNKPSAFKSSLYVYANAPEMFACAILRPSMSAPQNNQSLFTKNSPSICSDPPLRDEKQSHQSRHESIKPLINVPLNQSGGHIWYPSVWSLSHGPSVWSLPQCLTPAVVARG